jgi:isopenicillin-N epimerase
MNNLPAQNQFAPYWSIDPSVIYLNHGSFGATPTFVLKAQRKVQEAMEAEAIDFFVKDLVHHIDESKNVLASFVGTSAHNIVFTANTTTGVNTIFNNLPCKTGDEWLLTNHNYGACINAAKHYASKNGCIINVANIPYPLQSDDEIISAIEAAITPKTTIALIDYITSATATIFPVVDIIKLLHSKNIKVIIDAAHAPGMVPFHLDNLQADYFVANCHKWICSPKGSAFIYVAPQHQHHVAPLVISHLNDTAVDTPAHWSNQFIFDGTHDYSAYVVVKDAIQYMPTLLDGGWSSIMKTNHNLVWQGANAIANAMQVQLPTPEHMVGSICNIPMPDGEIPAKKFNSITILKKTLRETYNIEVPIFNYPAAPQQWLRISAQLYNTIEQYEYLIGCLREIYK